jgi:hypothetical protein
MGEFLDERHAQEEIHLATLNKALPKLQRQDLFLSAQDIIGFEALEELSKKL